MYKWACAASVTVAIVCASVAHGDLATIGTSKDNTLYEYSGSGTIRSNGAGDHFFSGVTANARIRRGLIAFDVAAAIPAGSTINSATLTLHMSRTISGDLSVDVRRAGASWGEGASNANNEEGTGAAAQTGDATWLHTFYNTMFWTSQGGDFAATPSATAIVGIEDFYTWASPTLTADVQGWLDGSLENFGWLVLADESITANAKRFDTRENLVPEYRPMLTIDYTEVPEPTSTLVTGAMLLLTCAGLGRRT